MDAYAFMALEVMHYFQSHKCMKSFPIPGCAGKYKSNLRYFQCHDWSGVSLTSHCCWRFIQLVHEYMMVAGSGLSFRSPSYCSSLACARVAACASGLLNATTSPTKMLLGDGRGIQRISSFSNELLLVPVLLVAAALRVGACCADSHINIDNRVARHFQLHKFLP